MIFGQIAITDRKKLKVGGGGVQIKKTKLKEEHIRW